MIQGGGYSSYKIGIYHHLQLYSFGPSLNGPCAFLLRVEPSLGQVGRTHRELKALPGLGLTKWYLACAREVLGSIPNHTKTTETKPQTE